jgi:hypothetical protein
LANPPLLLFLELCEPVVAALALAVLLAALLFAVVGGAVAVVGTAPGLPTLVALVGVGVAVEVEVEVEVGVVEVGVEVAN